MTVITRRLLPTLLALVCVVPVNSRAADADDWGEAMKQVHSRFKGEAGTFAQFGDSITVTLAYWSPLAYDPKNMSAAMAEAQGRVKKYLKPDCWRKWKGPDYGSNSSMTIRWANDNIDDWLKKLNPECALIMFGTNDLNQLDLKEYEEKTRIVVQKCLKHGTVVILSTIPPRTGKLDQCRKFAEVVRKIAKEEKLPVIDFLEEVLKRRPDDWDGSLPKFKEIPGDASTTYPRCWRATASIPRIQRNSTIIPRKR
jgi:lysophospholipase L1-like esterase